MRELPRHLVLEDFYMWFNMKDKEEYYATPLYLYNVLRKIQTKKMMKKKSKMKQEYI